MKNEKLILKLLRATKPDIILGMELLRAYSDKEIKRFFNKHDNYNKEFDDKDRGYLGYGAIKGASTDKSFWFSMIQDNRAIYCGDKDGYYCTIVLDSTKWEGSYTKDNHL